MKKLSIGILAGIVACGVAFAQDPASPATTPTNQPSTHVTQPAQANPTPTASKPASAAAAQPQRLAPGSVIPVQLTKSLDVKKVKTGDAVEAKVTQDLKSVNGDVVVPKDSKVVGHVTTAQAHTKEQKESTVAIAFDHAVLKDKGDVSMPMSIQAIIGPQNPQNQANADAAPSAPATSGGGMSPNAGGRTGTMSTQASSNAPAASPNTPADAQTNSTARPPITGNTKGVVGLPNLTLSEVPSSDQGSTITSEKGNVKLDSGTLLLLRVN